jgi:predicted alpha/beta superfamily hydrolase
MMIDRMIARFTTIFFVLSAFCGNAQMNIVVANVPQLTPLRDTLYVAGSFNNWNPRDENYRMELGPNGYSVSISGVAGSSYSYKITRGNWPTVEGSATGGFIGDRSLVYQSGATETISVLGWEDIGGNPTITEHVRILDSNFHIPQLQRNRRIWISFPPDYFTSAAYYPVVYMHDGQNVFNAGTSFSGEWRVDESMLDELEQACSQAIIVAIDNGGAQRINEYAPWTNSEYNQGGQGDEYCSFLVNTLKPFIDANYRTLSDRNNTAIMGSSLGALISAYAAFTYPEVFGKVGLFSSAYWFNPEIFTLAENHQNIPNTNIYHVCGTNEGNGSVLDDQNEMIQRLQNNGYQSDELQSLHWADGAHSEWFWDREFPAAYTWLIDCASNQSEMAISKDISLFPNPADTSFEIQSSGDRIVSIEILSQEAKAVRWERYFEPLYSLKQDVSELNSGVYFVVIGLDGGKRYTFRLIKQ